MPLCGIVGGADAVRRSRSQSLECALLLRSAQSTEHSQRSVTPVATPVRPRGAGGHNAAQGNRHARAAALTAPRAARRVRRRFRRFRRVGGRGVLRCLSAREPTPVANCDLQIFVGIHLRRRRVTSKISGTSPKLLSILYTSSDQATGRFTVLLGAEPDCPRSRSRSRRKPPGIEEREIARDTP